MAEVRDLDPEKFQRTDDMSLVTFLKMEGFTPQQIGWSNSTCYWWFRITDDLLAATEVFDGGDARIEPREYSKVYQSTKRDFYDSQPAARTASA